MSGRLLRLSVMAFSVSLPHYQQLQMNGIHHRIFREGMCFA
jgi:hypothetical protein